MMQCQPPATLSILGPPFPTAPGACRSGYRQTAMEQQHTWGCRQAGHLAALPGRTAFRQSTNVLLQLLRQNAHPIELANNSYLRRRGLAKRMLQMQTVNWGARFDCDINHKVRTPSFCRKYQHKRELNQLTSYFSECYARRQIRRRQTLQHPDEKRCRSSMRSAIFSSLSSSSLVSQTSRIIYHSFYWYVSSW